MVVSVVCACVCACACMRACLTSENCRNVRCCERRHPRFVRRQWRRLAPELVMQSGHGLRILQGCTDGAACTCTRVVCACMCALGLAHVCGARLVWAHRTSMHTHTHTHTHIHTSGLSHKHVHHVRHLQAGSFSKVLDAADYLADQPVGNHPVVLLTINSNHQTAIICLHV